LNKLQVIYQYSPYSPRGAKTETLGNKGLPPEKRPKLSAGLAGVLQQIKQDKKQSESQTRSGLVLIPVSINAAIQHEFSL
jgi:hypothetical protein